MDWQKERESHPAWGPRVGVVVPLQGPLGCQHVLRDPGPLDSFMTRFSFEILETN